MILTVLLSFQIIPHLRVFSWSGQWSSAWLGGCASWVQVYVKYKQINWQSGIKSIILSHMAESIQSSGFDYQPYQYPPDFDLAFYHQECSMPGTPDTSKPPCPCCKQYPKIPFTNWWTRSIEKDFKDYGGAVVSYFWLLKVYILAISVIVCVYGLYLQYLTQHYCDELLDEGKKKQVCSNLLGLWIISNGDLHDLMSDAGDRQAIVRFSTLRAITFLVLLATGIAALYVMKWFKVRYPQKADISSFSLLFKNMPTNSLQDLITRLRNEFGDFEIKQSFIVKKIQPFYSKYQEKLQTYYDLKIQSDGKKSIKLVSQLKKLQEFCSQHEEEYYNAGRRAIIVFYSREVKERIYKQYHISRMQNLKLFFNNKYSEERQIYCQECPKPQQIIWNNLGKQEKEGFHVKVKSIAYFFLILIVFYGLLVGALQLIYAESIIEPFKSIIQFLILLFMTVLAVTFRFIMDRLSQLRFPNTYTQRTVFIVMTTVVFHYLFYLFIPAIYLSMEVDQRGDVLKLIAGQTLSFAVLQVVLSYVDIIHCIWNKRRKRVQNQDKPVGCQKILHERIQYPRFPIEFKLIVLFKFWSLTTFFSFHTPIVMIFILLGLIYLYFQDKKNLYTHFRVQVITNQVQLNFLRFYTNVFVVFMFIIFVNTQHSTFEYVVSSIVVVAAVLFQNIYFRNEAKRNKQFENEVIPSTLDELDPVLNISYKDKYERFLEISKSDKVDRQIKQQLFGVGISSIEDENEITSKFLQ